MKKTSTLAFLLLALICVACRLGSMSGGAYTSAEDKFSIAFPSGSSGVETGKSEVKFAKSGRTYSKSFDNRSDNYRSYEVQVLDIDPSATTGKEPRKILEIGLNGWEDEPGTVVKDTTINRKSAIDSVRSVEIGPAKMSFRDVVVWSEGDKKLYVIQIAASKKENVSTKEADDFVNSFKLAG